MQAKLRDEIAFYLTSRIGGAGLTAMEGPHRPALLARYSDLTSLRYDLPLILESGKTFLSLSRVVDEAIESLGEIPERERIGRHAYRIEREIRSALADAGGTDLWALWNDSVQQLSASDPSVADSASRLWPLINVEGVVIDIDAEFSDRTMQHAWSVVQDNKAREFRQRTSRLLQRLREILEADLVSSPLGRQPERLRSAVGTPFAETFDFEMMSDLLVVAKPSFGLSEQRRTRIADLIDVLERQRFYPAGGNISSGYQFVFDSCIEALEAYRTRRAEAVELIKAVAIAELEINGDYREAIHDRIFDEYGTGGLDPGAVGQLPDYLVSVNADTLGANESARIMDAMAAGLPFTFLIRTDDLLAGSTVTEPRFALHAKALVNVALGLGNVFILQVAASHLYQKRDELMRGLSHDGPVLVSIFSGVTGHSCNVRPYLMAAAAVESRAFPTLVYDPTVGARRHERISLDGNPAPHEDWPVYDLLCEDGALQARSGELAFTTVDLMAMDDRFHDQFAISDGEVEDAISVPEALDQDSSLIPTRVPCVELTDEDSVLKHAVVSRKLIYAANLCLAAWRDLQDQCPKEKNPLTKDDLCAAATSTTVTAEIPAGQPPTPPVPAEAVETESPSIAPAGDEPYIETARCTSCNECTQINNKMFAYDENKQAYIADASAGTFRQLVEAAEGCQVSIIHPGKPRNPNEPGLDDLIKRAAEFN